MKHIKLNQNGFSAHILILLLIVAAAVGFAGYKVLQSDKTTSRVVDTAGLNQTLQITPEDQNILTQAKKLKKVDFDLDGRVNSLDSDDDNDGQDDDVDSDDDNDGEDDDVDNDDDNDGVDDDKDDEDGQEAEL